MRLYTSTLMIFLLAAVLQLNGQCDFTTDLWARPEKAHRMISYQDQLLLATDAGIYVFDPNSLDLVDHWNRVTTSLPSNHVEDIIINPETGDLVIGTYDIGMSMRKPDGSWEPLPYPDGFGDGFNPLKTFGMAYDGAGRLWVGTNYGILRYEEENWTEVSTTDLSSFFFEAWHMEQAEDGEILIVGNILLKTQGDSLYALSPTPEQGGDPLFAYGDARLHTMNNGHLWFLTDVGQAGYFDGEEWIIYDVFDDEINFPLRDTKFMVEDEMGRTWFYAGVEAGYLVYDSGVFSNETEWNGISDLDFYFQVDGQEIGIQSDKLFKLDSPETVSPSLNNYLTSGVLTNFKRDREGNVWAMDFERNLINLSQEDQFVPNPESQISFRDFVWAQDGTCWFIFGNEVWHWEAGELTFYSHENSELPQWSVLTELVVDGLNRPWVYQWQSAKWYGLIEGTWKTFPNAPEVHSYDAVGADQGIFIFNYDDTGSLVYLEEDGSTTSIPESQELGFNQVLSIAYDQAEKALYMAGASPVIAKWQDNTWSTIELPAELDQEDGIRQLTVLENGIMAAGHHQIMWLQQGDWCYLDLQTSPIDTERIGAMSVDDQGSLWVGHQNRAVLERFRLSSLVSSNQDLTVAAPQLGQLSPNPAFSSTQLNLDPSIPAEDVQIEILMLDGRSVGQFQATSQSTELSLTNLSSGIYLVCVQYGQSQQMLRLVKP